MSNFSSCHNVFKKSSAAVALKCICYKEMINKIWTLPTHWIVHLLFHWKTYQWKIGRFKINVYCTNIVHVPIFSLLSVFRITLTLKCVSLNFWMLITTRVHIIVVHSRLCVCNPTSLIFNCFIRNNNLNSYYHLWSFSMFCSWLFQSLPS